MIQRFSFLRIVLIALISTASISSYAAPNVGCPGDFAFTYTSQASVDESFSDYLRAFRTTENGCAITSTTDLSTFSAPSFTGGSVTIIFEATDCNGTERCTATFTALEDCTGKASAIPVCPGNMTLTNCMSDAEAMASFQSWLEGFGHTGGCNVTTTDLSAYSPPGCGGTTEVTYEVTSMGVTVGCTAFFAIPAEVAAPGPSVPTMGEWGIICLFLIFAIIGIVELKKSYSILQTK